jgi:hypothetical protein
VNRCCPNKKRRKTVKKDSIEAQHNGAFPGRNRFFTIFNVLNIIGIIFVFTLESGRRIVNIFKTLCFFTAIPFLAYSQKSVALIPLVKGNTWTYHTISSSNGHSVSFNYSNSSDIMRTVTITTLSSRGDTVNFTVSVHDSGTSTNSTTSLNNPPVTTSSTIDTSYSRDCVKWPNQFNVEFSIQMVFPNVSCNNMPACQNTSAQYAVPGRKTYNFGTSSGTDNSENYIIIDGIGVACGKSQWWNIGGSGWDSLDLASFNGKTLKQWNTTATVCPPRVATTHGAAAIFRVIAFGDHCGVRLVHGDRCYDIHGRLAALPKTYGRTILHGK